MTVKFQAKHSKIAPVLDLQSFRRKKQDAAHLSRGREPLYTSYKQATLTKFGSPTHKNLSDFSEKIANIRASLDKINALMADLKKLSAQADHNGN